MTYAICHGSCYPNPGGISVYAFIVKRENGDEIYREVGENSGSRTKDATVPSAFFESVVRALRWIDKQGLRGTVYVTSCLQMLERYGAIGFNEEAAKWTSVEKQCAEIRMLTENLDGLVVRYVKRKEIKTVSDLCRARLKELRAEKKPVEVP